MRAGASSSCSRTRSRTRTSASASASTRYTEGPCPSWASVLAGRAENSSAAAADRVLSLCACRYGRSARSQRTRSSGSRRRMRSSRSSRSAPRPHTLPAHLARTSSPHLIPTPRPPLVHTSPARLLHSSPMARPDHTRCMEMLEDPEKVRAESAPQHVDSAALMMPQCRLNGATARCPGRPRPPVAPVSSVGEGPCS